MILGADASRKEGISGSIVAAGAVVALVIAPLAGAVSDRWRAPSGRRRTFLLVGMLGTCLGLGLLIPFGPSGNLLFYLIVFLNLQLWWNVASGPYAGLIPDVVPEPDHGIASAWIIILSTLGTIAGYVIMAALYTHGHPATVILVFIGINLVCLVLTLTKVPGSPPSLDHSPFYLVAFIRSFWIDPRDHGNFYWVLATRLFVNMGIWWIFTFLSYYLRSIGVENAPNRLSTLLSVGLTLGIPACLIAPRLATHYGIIQVVQVTSLIMGIAVFCYVPLAIYPSFALGVLVLVIFGASYGAYQVADWTLALRVLPSRDTAGKDMGIWHICMVLPQILAPGISGWLISGIKMVSSERLAYITAFGIAAFWFILAAWLITRVRIPGTRMRRVTP